MKIRLSILAAAALALAALALVLSRPPPQPGPRPKAPAIATPLSGPGLDDLGPRLVSNRTSTPVIVTGRHLAEGDLVVVGPPANVEARIAYTDGWHGWTRLPPIDLPAAESERDLVVTLRKADGSASQGTARLTVVNDRHFPDPSGLAFANGHLCAISTTTDELACRGEGPEVVRLKLASGPTAITPAGDDLLIGFEYASELWLVPASKLAEDAHQVLAGPRSVTGLAWSATDGVAYVAEHLSNSLWAIDVRHEGKVLWKTPIDPGPGRVILAGENVAVASRQAGEVQLVRAKDGALVATLSPEPGTPIAGGRSAPFSSRVDGGLAVRDLAWSPRSGLLFVASSGPNLGPNPERMEIAMNGGITVYDPKAGKALYHLGFGAGVTEALALDEQRGVLFAADVALGLVRALDVAHLKQGPAGLGKAGLEWLTGSSVAIPPPQDFPLVLPREELGIKGRAGVELHSGPKALALGKGGEVWALGKLSGTLAQLRLGPERLEVVDQTRVFDALTQPRRRQGQVLYYADVGRTSMSCDACHPDGHVGGILFSKTQPLRMYRATSVRGSRETPPYFIPASEGSLESTAQFVGSRNRFHNPSLSKGEVAALALFASEIPTPPNPFVQEDGAPPETLTLPDGPTGRPREGAKLFFGKARCGDCHPAPLFANDQTPANRGEHYDVGTPNLFPLRTELQDQVKPLFPAQSLNGIWDLFPLLSTGTAGFAEKDGHLFVQTRFPLRAVLEHRGSKPHGEVAGLGASEVDDLLAFLMTL